MLSDLDEETPNHFDSVKDIVAKVELQSITAGKNSFAATVICQESHHACKQHWPILFVGFTVQKHVVMSARQRDIQPCSQPKW